MLKILKNKNILYILLSVGFFLIINAVNIYYYTKANYIAGWDGFGHVAISYAYHNEVFPHIFGNIKVWFNGMPFSHFYPPLFYVTTSLLAFVKDQVLFMNLFKIFNISMLVFTVIGFYFLALEFLKSKEKALVANILFVLLLSTYKRFGDLGISVESVFNYGFLPQSFSFIFLILFLIFFNKESSVKNRVVSSLSLLCVAISNIHVLFIAVFYICTYLAYLLCTKDFIELKKKMIDCSLAGLVSLFWFLPMFYYYQFSGAKSSNYGGFEFIDNYLIISMIFSAISVYIAHKEKNKKIAILALYIFIISICNYLPLTELIVSIPLHVKRWIIAPILLLPILSLYIINKNRVLKGISFIALITVFFTYIFSVPQQNMLGYFTSATQDEFQPMVDWIIANKKDSDLINVESAYIGDVSDFWYIHAMLGMNGVNTTYAILRESSVTSFAFATIRNSISTDQEAIGTKFNLFGQNKKRNYFINQGIDMGISHFLVKTDFSKKALSKNKNVVLEKKFKEWNLYKATNPVEKTTAANLKVILTYTDFNLKKNTDNQFDITRLAEELIYNDMLDLIFYQSSENDLSKESNHLASSGVFITQYKYSDLEKAYNNIVKISQDRPVFLLKEYENDLFKKLYKNLENTKNIYFINPKNYTINSDSYHENYRYIFKFIDARAKDFKSNEFTYIRKSYFPDIHAEHKRYVATPFYILESKTEKNDDTFDIIKLAGYVSLISVLGGIVYFTYISRKKS